MNVGGVNGGNVGDVDLDAKKTSVFSKHTIKQAQKQDGMVFQKKTVTTQETPPPTNLDSRPAVVDVINKEQSVKMAEQIYCHQHPLLGLFSGVRNRIKNANKNILTKLGLKPEQLEWLKENAKIFHDLLIKEFYPSKHSQLKACLVQNKDDGPISFMILIEKGVEDSEVNDFINTLNEGIKNLLGLDGKFYIDKQEVKLNTLVTGYPENYTKLSFSPIKDENGNIQAILVLPDTPESKKKLTEMLDSAQKTLRILENIKKIYSEGSDELNKIENAIKDLNAYIKNLEESCKKFKSSDTLANKLPVENKLPDIQFTASVNEASISTITDLLNIDKLISETGGTNAQSPAGYLDSRFTNFTNGDKNKITDLQFTPAPDDSTTGTVVTCGTNQTLTGNICILHQKTTQPNTTEYELYTYNKDGSLKKETFTGGNAEQINANILTRLAKLNIEGFEILLTKGKDLYTMGHGKELDFTITESKDGYKVNIKAGDFPENAEQQFEAAIQEIWNNIPKSDAKTNALIKFKLEAVIMILRMTAAADGKLNENELNKLIEQKYKKEYKKLLSKDDYEKLKTFAETMADEFTKFAKYNVISYTAVSSSLPIALAEREKGNKCTIEIPNIFEGVTKTLTINFAESKQLTDLKDALKGTKIDKKNIDDNATLNALTAAANPKLKKADKSGDATQFSDLSLSDKITVLKQAHDKAKLANQLVELQAKKDTSEEYIKLLGNLANNSLLKNVKVNLNGGDKQVPQLLADTYTCLMAAHEQNKTDFKGDFKFDKEPFTTADSPEKKALDMIKSAGIKTDGSAQDLFNAILEKMKIDYLDAGAIQQNCAKFKGTISQAICNAQLVGLSLKTP